MAAKVYKEGMKMTCLLSTDEKADEAEEPRQWKARVTELAQVLCAIDELHLSIRELKVPT